MQSKNIKNMEDLEKYLKKELSEMINGKSVKGCFDSYVLVAYSKYTFGVLNPRKTRTIIKQSNNYDELLNLKNELKVKPEYRVWNLYIEGVE